ncbi:hypothetical protein VTJ83DRAFT_3040 [Remersonia thermophila]|uniref:Zn(2)-C6 fungal-type domain-containing protein n=1 Tax=Remersonia thermophila TaxID=72144 RepID=A0ABR4DCX2_9PEZI
MPSKRRLTETETTGDTHDAPSDPPPSLPPPGQPQAPVKRQRVSRACDQCRAARERCDGKQPECHPCVAQNRPCTYEVSPKKRGVQTGYIRTLELALGCIFEKVSGSEDVLTAHLARERSQGHLVLTGKDPGEADRLQKRWRQSRAHTVIERILSGEALPSPGLDDTSPLADASDVDHAARADGLPNAAALDAGAPSQKDAVAASSTLSQCPPPTPNDGSAEYNTPGLTQPEGVLQPSHGGPRRLKLPADHWRLLDVYFSYTHSWLPILEKQALFQASYLYPDNGLAVDPLDASSAVHAELWAALALASCQDAAGSKRLSDGHANASASSPSHIYSIARGLIPAEDGPFQINHARALALLSLVNLAQGKLSGAGLLIGSAIRILFDLDASQSALPKPGQTTNLTWMACFIVDATLSIVRRRPSHLRPEHLDALPLASENGPDQWEPWTACDGFGVGSAASSRASRSPAFCSSTFNALYSIVQAVSREVSLDRRSLLPEKLDGLVSRLQQAAGPSSPFGEFVTSQTCGGISAPTPYLVRAMYLWASALAEPCSEAPLLSLQDTLDSFQRQFGRHGMPPIIHVAVASLANDEFLLRCSENNRRRVGVLVSSYSAPWQLGDRNSSGIGRSPSISSSLHPSQGQLASPARTSPFQSPVIRFPTPNVSSFFSRQPSTTPRHEAPDPSRAYDSFVAPTMAGAYIFPDDPAAGMIAGSETHMRQAGPPTAPPMPGGSLTGPTMTGMHRSHPSSGSIISPSAFGTTPDFDALLDDLASIEGVDAVDADAQFMTNLGFAPGCDITEILTRGFGGA